MLYVGTCGFSYDDWRGHWYPPNLLRARYFDYCAERFRTVEVDSTFYQIYSPRMMISLVGRARAGCNLPLRSAIWSPIAGCSMALSCARMRWGSNRRRAREFLFSSFCNSSRGSTLLGRIAGIRTKIYEVGCRPRGIRVAHSDKIPHLLLKRELATLGQMPKKTDLRTGEITIESLYPHLTPEERGEAEANLTAYLSLVLRVFDRIHSNPTLHQQLRTLTVSKRYATMKYPK